MMMLFFNRFNMTAHISLLYSEPFFLSKRSAKLKTFSFIKRGGFICEEISTGKQFMKCLRLIFFLSLSAPLFCQQVNSPDTSDLLQDKEFLTKFFKRRAKLTMNWDNPITFCEKIQWMKLYNRHPIQTICADKYLARKFVAEHVGPDILIPLFGVYKNANEIDFTKLPSKFVLKANHGCAWNIICKNKETLDQDVVRKNLNSWLQIDYSTYGGEWVYKNIPRRIICEQFIGEDDNDVPDFKFYCFNGKPEFVQVSLERFHHHKMAFYNMSWEKQPLSITYPPYSGPIEKPVNFERMVEIAKKLSENFKFIRVDLYNVKGKIYFGELTFYPGDGILEFMPKSYDLIFGDLLDLNDPSCPY